jgi:TolA protein
MRAGLPISTFGHAAVLAWAIISFSSRPFDTAESLPVDLISTSEFSQLTAGAQSAKKVEKPRPVVDKVGDPKPVPDPTPKVAEKPPIEPAAAEPPPSAPPTPQPKEAKPAEPKVDTIAEALKKEEAKRLEEQKKLDQQKKLDELKLAEEQKKIDEQRKAEEQRKIDEQRKAEEQKKLDEQRRAEEQRKREEARKRAEAKKIEEARKREESKKLEEKIAALLDKREPRREAATGAVLNSTPSLGAPMASAATLSQTELDALRARLITLWSPPESIFMSNPDQYIVRVRIQLGRDHRLSAPPEVTSSGSGTLYEAAADAAKRAVLRAQPFDMLSAATYETWRDIEVTFDPRDRSRI